MTTAPIAVGCGWIVVSSTRSWNDLSRRRRTLTVREAAMTGTGRGMVPAVGSTVRSSTAVADAVVAGWESSSGVSCYWCVWPR